MRIVIDIPEELYEANNKGLEAEKLWDLRMAVKNGTPLPKGHGKLIILSEDAIKREQTSLSFSCQNWISEVGLSNATVAIIEADKGESEVQDDQDHSKAF